MRRVVVACYRPKPGCGDSLRSLLLTHVRMLQSIGLATSRKPVTMEAEDGTFVEVFEWASAEAIQAAHAHPVVLGMWQQFGELCDYVPVAQVYEASQLFAEFAPVDNESE